MGCHGPFAVITDGPVVCDAAHLPDPVLDQGEQAGVEWLQLRGITKDGVLVVLGDLAVAGAAELPLPVPEPSLLDVLLAFFFCEAWNPFLLRGIL